MEQYKNFHVEFWTKGFFPLAFFKGLLEKVLEGTALRYFFVEDKHLPYFVRLKTSAQLSIGLTSQYYTDFIINGDAETLYDLILKGLQPITDFVARMDADRKADWINLRDNKYEFIYECSDKLPLHFSFKSNWSETLEKEAYDRMIAYIHSYENKDEKVHTEIQGTPSDKDQIRFFLYDTGTSGWMIQDLLSDITLNISTGYQKAKKDGRVAKPDILINEDKFNEHFVFDQQWVLTLDKFQVIMARPNDVALYLNLMDRNLAKARPFLEDAIKRRNKNPFYNMMLDEESTSLFYDYFENIISAVTYSYTAIETLANICIEENYEHTKKEKGVTTIYDKEGIERFFKLRDKFKVIIRAILTTPDPSAEKWWQDFILLEDIRDKIIHTKQSSSQERYSMLLSPKIFTIIEVSKTILKYYGNYIKANLRHILADFPFGYGFDNTVPAFMTNTEYWKSKRRMHGIPELPDDQ
ncbi:hypothetical protein HB364_31705 [Pseudoflavitalea sp. X16]|uniref:hypothetical protein n=1 Tax=Paraflavitalea devenefica TaxID=2716334 RepID=UPI00141DFAFC|nr:hypothetical protein [Paraflavitalea devenefica]NII29686.1 hypothetical protein [Paraflavitalea devenefica]